MWQHGRHRWGRRGWLRPWILGILRAGPKNGAEIMDQIEQMSLGRRPSAGSVYHLLEEMATEGLVKGRDDGRYELTVSGGEGLSGPWDFFAHGPPTVEGLIAEMRSNVSYLEDLKAGNSEKLGPHLPAIGELGARLQRISAR